jgi:hypothetical protein
MSFNKKFSMAKGHFRDTNLVCNVFFAISKGPTLKTKTVI